MKKSKKLLAAALAMALAAGSIACGGSSENTDVKNGASDQSEQFAISQAIHATLSSLDPQLSSAEETSNIVLRVSEPLYKVGKDGSIVLGMASDAKTSEDGLTWTFTIREGVKWSNGEPVTAHDFEYAFKRLAAPNTGAEYANMLESAAIVNAAEVCYHGADLDSLGVEATDDSTFVIHLERPIEYLPDLLLAAYFTPINQKFCEAQGDQFGLSIANTLMCGQYTVEEWESGATTVSLVKNPDYYAADEVTVDKLVYTTITDTQQQIMAFESKTIDVTPISGDNVDAYRDTPAYKSFGYTMMYFIAFNEEVKELQNENLRKAIAYSIDKTNICETILKDGSVPANYLVAENFMFDDNGKSFRDNANKYYLEPDKEKGKEYWEKAKSELGLDKMEFNFLYDEDSTLELVASFIQSELQNNLDGLTITLSTEPKNQRVEDMGNGNYDIGITRWGADYQDAASYLDQFAAQSTYYGKGAWSNDRYNELYNLIYGEYATQPDKRLAALIEQEDILLSCAAVCPLYQAAKSYLCNPDYNFVVCPTFYTYQYQYTTKK